MTTEVNEMEIVGKLVSHHGVVMDLALHLGAYVSLSVLVLLVHLNLK